MFNDFKWINKEGSLRLENMNKPTEWEPYFDFTEIEKIYIQKFNINTKDLTLNERMNITETAYLWATDMKGKCGFNPLLNKRKFVEWLKENGE